jgi:hypothetical protein
LPFQIQLVPLRAGLVNGDSYWMVNGQINPTATLEAGQWTRVRMA